MRFVSALHPSWSISIFHYRNHGADVGRIVVGVLVPEDEQSGLADVFWMSSAIPAGRKPPIPPTPCSSEDQEIRWAITGSPCPFRP